jgi:hypothetical protein
MTSKVYLAVRVPVDPARAFEAFTRDIASWWRPDPLFQITPDGDGELRFEPGPDGRLVTRLGNGELFESRSSTLRGTASPTTSHCSGLPTGGTSLWTLGDQLSR